MKKFILTFLVLTLPAYAYQNYMLISNEPVKSVIVKNPEIVEAKALYTIDNQKKIIIISPKANGKTTILIDRQNGDKKINCKAESGSVKFSNYDGFTLFLMDTPPSEAYIPEPPLNLSIPKPPKGEF